MNSPNPAVVIALDVGDKRVGVAWADMAVKVPIAHQTINVDGQELKRLKQVIDELKATIIVVGLPRNQSGATTPQTDTVRAFAEQLEPCGLEIQFQDESLTSVLAEKYLRSLGKPFTKADIDAHAAVIILGDYLEAHHVA
jgi:putative Holliday junction resolvase